MAPKYLSGVAFGVLLYLSSTLGAIFFMTPFLPLVALYPPLARTVADYLVASWKTFAVGLYELVFGVKVVFTGEPSPPQHGVVVVMNHRTRLDWLFYFSYELRYGNIAQGKIILKSLLKHIPGPGWAMQFGMFLFLQRRWEVDKPMLTRVIQYFQALRYSPQILIFPEGTDLTEKTQAKSDEFARKENLQPYRYVLHPRTTGFVYLVRTLMEGDSVSSLADITIAYPQNLCQNESDIIKGDFPREIHFHVQSYPIKTVDTTEEGLATWCRKVWAKKEQRLSGFYEENQNFEMNKAAGDNFCAVEPRCLPSPNVQVHMYAALILYFSLIFIALYFIVFCSLVRWYAFLCFVIFSAIGYFCDGVDMVQTKLAKPLVA